MARSKSRIKREIAQAGGGEDEMLDAIREDDAPSDAAQDNTRVPSARAGSTAPKKPATVSLEQEVPDLTPQLTAPQFIRGTADPILRAFAAHEKLTHGVRKLTQAGWQAEFESFKKASR